MDYVLDTTIFRELYSLDLLDTTFYAHDGFLNGKHAVVANRAVAEQINSLFTKAIDLSEQELSKNPEDVDALFARGWARSLRAVYIGMVERSFVSALHVALQARSDNEKVLRLDPRYMDAKLVVGVHQYVTGSLPFGLKILAGAAGITGSKSKGYTRLTRCRGTRRDHFCGGPDGAWSVPSPGGKVRRGDRGHAIADRRVSAGFSLPA